MKTFFTIYAQVWYRYYTDSTVQDTTLVDAALDIEMLSGTMLVPQFLLVTTWRYMKPGYSGGSSEVTSQF